MGLVTYTYYTQTYMGEPVQQADFPRYDARAEDLILGLINKSAADVLAITSQSVQEAVKKAICCQIEYFFEYGLNVAVAGREGGGGFTVGKVSVNNGSTHDGQMLHAEVLEFAHPTTGEQMRFKTRLPDDMLELKYLLENI